MTTPIFKLTGFTPVGYKVRNYALDMCMLCRGPLTEVCYVCQEKSVSTCHVITDNGVDYHSHCFSLLKANIDSKKGTIKE